MLSAIGKNTILLLAFPGEISLIIFRSFLELRGFFQESFRPTFRVLLKQILFSGIHAWTVIIVLFFLIGTLVITQIIEFTGTEGALIIGKILVWVVIREVGPLLTAMIVVARSGAAISTELASMKINKELWALEAMGISANRYIIMPRVMGMAISVAMLALYAEIAAVNGGFLIGAVVLKIPISEFRQALIPLALMRQILFSIIKSFVFGLVIGAVCCRQGLSVEGDHTQVPVAATKGVMRSLLMVFLIDAVVQLVSIR